MKKILLAVTMSVLVLALCACGAGSDKADASSASASAASASAAEEDGQNPIMNFVGAYAAGRCSILIEADGMDGVKASVTWGSSAYQTSVWEMSGKFDADTLTFTYENGVRRDIEFEENGDEKSSVKVYTDGTGTMTFSDEGDVTSLTWQDDKENIAEDMTFEYAN